MVLCGTGVENLEFAWAVGKWLKSIRCESTRAGMRSYVTLGRRIKI